MDEIVIWFKSLHNYQAVAIVGIMAGLAIILFAAFFESIGPLKLRESQRENFKIVGYFVIVFTAIATYVSYMNYESESNVLIPLVSDIEWKGYSQDSIRLSKTNLECMTNFSKTLNILRVYNAIYSRTGSIVYVEPITACKVDLITIKERCEQ